MLAMSCRSSTFSYHKWKFGSSIRTPDSSQLATESNGANHFGRWSPSCWSATLVCRFVRGWAQGRYQNGCVLRLEIATAYVDAKNHFIQLEILWVSLFNNLCTWEVRGAHPITTCALYSIETTHMLQGTCLRSGGNLQGVLGSGRLPRRSWNFQQNLVVLL